MWQQLKQLFGQPGAQASKPELSVTESRNALIFSYGAPFSYVHTSQSGTIYYQGPKKIHTITPGDFTMFCKAFEHRLEKVEGDLCKRTALDIATQIVQLPEPSSLDQERLRTLDDLIDRAPIPYCHGEQISISVTPITGFYSIDAAEKTLLFSPIDKYSTPESISDWESLRFRAELRRFSRS